MELFQPPIGLSHSSCHTSLVFRFVELFQPQEKMPVLTSMIWVELNQPPIGCSLSVYPMVCMELPPAGADAGLPGSDQPGPAQQRQRECFNQQNLPAKWILYWNYCGLHLLTANNCRNQVITARLLLDHCIITARLRLDYCIITSYYFLITASFLQYYYSRLILHITTNITTYDLDEWFHYYILLRWVICSNDFLLPVTHPHSLEMRIPKTASEPAAASRLILLLTFFNTMASIITTML